jgi:hypothetical protein
MTLRSEFHGSCSDPARNGEASYVDPTAQSTLQSKRRWTTTTMTTTSATSSSCQPS